MGDDKSDVRVYRYPTINNASEYLIGRGHSSFISKVKWTSDDNYLVSIGGEDNSVFVWKINKYIYKNGD
jgi:WD40 repeat protein